MPLNKTLVKGAVWFLLTVTFIAWLLVPLGLAVSSGTPHYAGSGWSQARAEAQTHFVYCLTLLFCFLPSAFFAEMFAFGRLNKKRCTTLHK